MKVEEIFDALILKYSSMREKYPEYVIWAGNREAFASFPKRLLDKSVFLYPLEKDDEQESLSEKIIEETALEAGEEIMRLNNCPIAAVFFTEETKWRYFLIKLLEIICFSNCGGFVAEVDKIFWDSVVRCMRVYEKTKRILDIRRQLFGNNSILSSVIKKLEECKCGCNDYENLTGISVGSPLDTINHQIIKRCKNCGLLKIEEYIEDRRR